MNKDYTYCSYTKCLHKLGCKRFIGNHILEFFPNRWMDGEYCSRSNYSGIDRFRNSDGTELKEDK